MVGRHRNAWILALGVVGALGTVTAAVASPVSGGAHTPDGTPTVFCSSRFVQMLDSPGTPALPMAELVDDGCISGSSSAYDAPGTSQDGWDGYYDNTGGGDPESAVELQIALAVGQIVELESISKQEVDGAANGIAIDVQNGGKTISWQVVGNAFQVAYVTIKASNSFKLYQIPSGAFGGQFTTQGILTNSGQQPGVSHIQFWFAENLVPEPAALGLLGLGLVGIAAARRRRS